MQVKTTFMVVFTYHFNNLKIIVKGNYQKGKNYFSNFCGLYNSPPFLLRLFKIYNLFKYLALIKSDGAYEMFQGQRIQNGSTNQNYVIKVKKIKVNRKCTA